MLERREVNWIQQSFRDQNVAQLKLINGYLLREVSLIKDMIRVIPRVQWVSYNKVHMSIIGIDFKTFVEEVGDYMWPTLEIPGLVYWYLRIVYSTHVSTYV